MQKVRCIGVEVALGRLIVYCFYIQLIISPRGKRAGQKVLRLYGGRPSAFTRRQTPLCINGRNIDLSTGSRIVTRGYLDNPYLQDTGAGINLVAGAKAD